MIQTLSTPIVQKYGGSSLSTLDKVRSVARKIVRSAETGRPVVVVVSAMGDTTSELIGRARALSASPPRRELDVLLSSGERMSMALLAMAIEEEGRAAISLTGPQCGIVTDDRHTNATILDVRPERVSRELARQNVVIVAGYQGISTAGEVTTLGRGGSDTTAVALAAALSAERCEIYSDVPGVYTADPRIVAEPGHLKQVDAALMSEYALHGARVLHPACIDLARRHGVPVHALATFGDERHTRIAADCGIELWPPTAAAAPSVLGVTSRKRRLRLCGPAASHAEIAAALESVDERDGLLRGRATETGDWLVDVEDLPDADGFTGALKERLAGLCEIEERLASVSVVSATAVTPRLERRVAALLGAAGAAVAASYPRAHSVTCAIESGARRDAVRALHESLVEEPLAVSH